MAPDPPHLKGQLPATTSNMPRLTTFVVDDTALSGEVPQAWASLNLRDFAAARTKLTGTLPTKAASGYRRTDLTGNSFRCPAPENYNQKSVGCNTDASLAEETQSIPIGVIVVLATVAVAAVAGIAHFAMRRGAEDRVGETVLNQFPLEDGSYALMDDKSRADAAL